MNLWKIIGIILVGLWIGGAPSAWSRPGPASVATQMNVRDFGASGNGKTDDTKAIQAAIDSLEFGGIVFFPPGKYLCSNLHLHRSCILEGAGVWATKLIPKDAIPVITVHETGNIVIRDLSIRHDRSFPANGILLSDRFPARWFTLQNIWIYGLKGYAIKTKKFVWESLVDNCQFRMCGDINVPVIWMIQNTGEKEGINHVTFRKCVIGLHHGVAISIKSDVEPGGWGGPDAGVRKLKFIDCFIHGATSELPSKSAPVNSIEIDNYSDIYFDKCMIVRIASNHYGLKLDSSIAAKGKRAHITNCWFGGDRNCKGIYLGNVSDTFIFGNTFRTLQNPDIYISSKAVRTKILTQAQDDRNRPLVIMDHGINTYNTVDENPLQLQGQRVLDVGKLQGVTAINQANNYGGKVTVAPGQTYVDVVLPIRESNENYGVVYGTSWLTITRVTNLSPNGFRLEFGTPPNNSASGWWLLVR